MLPLCDNHHTSAKGVESDRDPHALI
ncbi:protein of unknown function [Candidatus Nitrospira inopinata]|uniref:Uncharacterized protein n=1 Tax=Candidatus Nitrospira inopinata TaxID=1715989 RepID=A0A0S4KSY8_9BACT|nr:protein of unknown function [Candidatus Nitrospira inopinata]